MAAWECRRDYREVSGFFPQQLSELSDERLRVIYRTVRALALTTKEWAGATAEEFDEECRETHNNFFPKASAKAYVYIASSYLGAVVDEAIPNEGQTYDDLADERYSYHQAMIEGLLTQ